MRKFAVAFLAMAIAIPAAADKKIQGTASLKDLQPTGMPDKHNKHQAYDLSFNAADKAYTCRTSPKKSTNVTNFVVGTDMRYEIDGSKVKIKTDEGKQVECKVVRVEAITTAR